MIHDIGNPPFGHAGEKAIQYAVSKYFKNNVNNKVKDNLECKDFKDAVNDLSNFDGNAYGLHVLLSRKEFNLTYASLSAMIKYPYLYTGTTVTVEVTTTTTISTDKKDKVGVFNIDNEKFEDIQKNTGLFKKNDVFIRNPLSLIMEASDDIANAIMDIEDALRLKIINPYDKIDNKIGNKRISHRIEFHKRVFRRRVFHGRIFDSIYDIAKGYLSKNTKKEFEKEKNKQWYDIKDREDYPDLWGKLRSAAIHGLIIEAKEEFMHNYVGIMCGSFANKYLLKKHKELKEIKDFSFNNIYKNRNELLLEASGYKVISSLLEYFLSAIYNEDDISKHGLSILKKECTTYKDDGSETEKLIATVGFIARMSDNYAIELYQRINGIRIQGIE